MNISIFIMPILVLLILIYGFKKKVALYDNFIKGAKEGLVMVFNIFAPIIAMVFAINIFLKSEFIYFLLQGFDTFLLKYNIALEVLPMAFIRPISGTATLVILNDMYKEYGPDSFIGRLASIIQGCTDTTLYVITLYFSSVKIKKIRYSLSVGLLADLMGIIMSFILMSLFF